MIRCRQPSAVLAAVLCVLAPSAGAVPECQLVTQTTTTGTACCTTPAGVCAGTIEIKIKRKCVPAGERCPSNDLICCASSVLLQIVEYVATCEGNGCGGVNLCVMSQESFTLRIEPTACACECDEPT